MDDIRKLLRSIGYTDKQTTTDGQCAKIVTDLIVKNQRELSFLRKFRKFVIVMVGANQQVVGFGQEARKETKAGELRRLRRMEKFFLKILALHARKLKL